MSGCFLRQFLICSSKFPREHFPLFIGYVCRIMETRSTNTSRWRHFGRSQI